MTIMGGPLERFSKTVSISSGAGLTTDLFSTYLNGYIESAYIKAGGTGPGANVNVVLSISTSTTITLLKVVNPSSLGATYYPRTPTISTTAATLGATSNNANAYTRIPLVNERVRIGITTTSDLTGETWDVSLNIAKA
jgi:hypothetical protein